MRLLLCLVVLGAGCGEEGRPPLEPGPVGPSPCPLDALDRSGACWERNAPYGSGAFPGEWRPGKFPLGLQPVAAFGQLWMVGQTRSFSSTDGLAWTAHDKADWGERIGYAVIFFHDELWMLGGLAYQSRAFLRDVWRSSDGVRWQPTGDAAWPGREDHTVVSFQGRLWLLGGAVHVAAADRSPDGFVNDVWSSDDGVRWTLVTTAAPWPAMDYPEAQVFHDALFVLGGQGQGDVWRSADGVQWTRLERPPWPVRFDQASAVFDDRLWVFGGEPAPRAPRHSGVPIPALNDVWHSADGVTWLRQTEHAPWTPRSTRTSAVFRDRLWLFSGKRTGAADNWGGDLWTMRARP